VPPQPVRVLMLLDRLIGIDIERKKQQRKEEEKRGEPKRGCGHLSTYTLRCGEIFTNAGVGSSYVRTHHPLPEVK